MKIYPEVNYVKRLLIGLSITAVYLGNVGHHYSALSVFSENMGHCQPIKILVNKVSHISETLW